MAGMAALHESKIVHADLKPGNVYLIEDKSIGAGYQLKLIDTDFSVLAGNSGRVRGNIGQGGRKIRFSTGNGRIPIRKGG